MAAGWSTVAIFLGGMAVGAGSVQWWHERALRLEAERQLSDAKERPAQHVAAERRLTQAEATREAGKERARRVDSAALADCPLPVELSELLNAQAAATRPSAGRKAVPDSPVP